MRTKLENKIEDLKAINREHKRTERLAIKELTRCRNLIFEFEQLLGRMNRAVKAYNKHTEKEIEQATKKYAEILGREGL